MALSLWNNNVDDKDNCANNGACSSSSTEMDHMFDKVVTPSDVGKLNRLVIPKHHAEKFFPLDHSSDEKDLLLNFEDRNGKPWRFRYSYWNSSQSYVMTKGWSRFVKEKKLDAGDIVSFHRRVGESGSSRLYIDWRRRTSAPDPSWFANLELRNQMQFSESVRWGTLHSLPQSLSILPYQQQSQFQPQFNRSIEQCHHHHHPSQQYHQYQHQDQQAISYGDVAATQYYSRPPCKIQIGGVLHHQQGGGVGGNHDGDDDHHNHDLPMAIGSVRPVHGKTVGKRLRLFGVNMECPIQDDKYPSSSSLPHLDSSSIPLSPDPDQLWSTTENSKKGKTNSLSFDLDL